MCRTEKVGATALYWAASNGKDAIVALLLDKGADVTAKDNVSYMKMLRIPSLAVLNIQLY